VFPVHSILKPVAFLLTLGVSLSSFSQARPTNRIAQAIDDRETIVLHGNVRPLLEAATDQGRMDGGIPLTISMAFKKTAAQEAALEKLLAEQQDPSSPNYHKWLTPQQFADRFGMSTGDIATVTNWLQSQGFKVERVANSRTQMWFSGPVSKIETTFRTEMHNYELKGEPHFANATELSVPAALGDVVLGFHNTDNFRPRARAKIRQISGDELTPHFTSSLTGNHFLIPGDFATIYDLPAAVDGTGQTIAVMGQTALFSTGTGGISPPAAPTDIVAFRAAAGLPAITTANFKQTLVPTSGTAVVSTSDIGEASLDVEWSEGVAKGATQNYVFVGNNGNFSVFDSLQYTIDNNLAPVISISYGNCEHALGASGIATIQGWAQQANTQGQTITAASGDFGAADCDTSSSLPATGGLGVDIPAALPYVTGIGGTEFSGDPAGTVEKLADCGGSVGAAATTYWGESCSLTSPASALMYIPETTWNDTTAANSLSATGGGASVVFGKPSWQIGTGVPNDGARDVPDVSLAASPNHDGYLLCSQNSCVNGFRLSSSDPTNPNGLNVAGGTSFGAPAFAGIVAILNQKIGSKQGNINPTLYAVAASTPTAFHDITSGNNIVPCRAGTTNCPTTGTAQYGFSAGTGYDLVTGLGTIDANALVNAWASGNPTAPDYMMFGTISTISAPGGTSTSTITVDARNGFGGTVTLSCTPPTSVFITCSLSSSSIALSSSTTTGTSTLTVKTNSTAGLHRQDAPLAPFFADGGAVFAGVFALGLRNRRRSLTVALIVIMLALVLASVGCGGSSHSSSGGGSTTPAGTYTVTVTGTSGSTTHTTNVSVTVQ
jgi:subtilase family serine protease